MVNTPINIIKNSLLSCVLQFHFIGVLSTFSSYIIFVSIYLVPVLFIRQAPQYKVS